MTSLHLNKLAWTSCSLVLARLKFSCFLPRSWGCRLPPKKHPKDLMVTMIWFSSTQPCQFWLKMTLGCRAQPKMHLMTNSIQLNLISKWQVNLQKDNLQVTINPNSEVELLFKFECVVDAFECSSPLIMSLTCSLL